MAKFFECGFMRVQILQKFEFLHHTKDGERYRLFRYVFPHIQIERKVYNRKSSDLKNFSRKNRWFGEEKNKFMRFYSFEKTLKEQNQTGTCKACSKNYTINKIFPVTGK